MNHWETVTRTSKIHETHQNQNSSYQLRMPGARLVSSVCLPYLLWLDEMMLALFRLQSYQPRPAFVPLSPALKFEIDMSLLMHCFVV